MSTPFNPGELQLPEIEHTHREEQKQKQSQSHPPNHEAKSPYNKIEEDSKSEIKGGLPPLPQAHSARQQWPDGKVSIEMHLEVYIQDLQTLAVNRKKDDMLLNDVLDGVQFLFNSRIHKKIGNLEKPVCDNLLTALMEFTIDVEPGWRLKPVLTGEAEKALDLIYQFLSEIEEFRQSLGQHQPSELMKKIKFHYHLRSHNPEHVKTTLLCLQLITSNFSHMSDWRDLIKVDEHEHVESMLATLDKQEPIVSKRKNDNMMPPKGAYFDYSMERVIEIFQTNPENGLSVNDIMRRRDFYGTNQLPAIEKPSAFKILLNQFADSIVLVLLAAAVTSFGVGDFKAGIVLLVVILLNAVIGFFQELKAERALDALMSLSVPTAVVVRDGKQQQVGASELVPGDVVLLDEGVAVPADLRLVDTAQLFIVEAVLTGESVAVAKDTKAIRGRSSVPIGDRSCNAFMTTVVARGRGRGVVVSTGATTEVGRINQAISSSTTKKTPLQEKLGRLGHWLVLVSFLACGAVIGIGLGRGYGEDIVKVGISLAVSVIPEGLVAVVTLTMALGMQRMAQKNAIVRKLPSVETLGSVTTICSDKTGTLTEGKMKVSELWAAGHVIEFTGRATQPEEGEIRLKTSPPENPEEEIKESSPLKETVYPVSDNNNNNNKDRFGNIINWTLMCSALCNNASISIDADEKQPNNKSQAAKPGAPLKWKFVGDSTEIALAVAVHRTQSTKEVWRDQYFMTFVREFAFDSDRKRMSVLYTLPGSGFKNPNGRLFGALLGNNTHVILAKGAPEALLEQCTHFLAPEPNSDNVQALPMSEEEERKIETVGARMASQGMRVLALAVRLVASNPEDPASQAVINAEQSGPVEKDLCFVGLAAILDPPRAAVSEAVAKCRQAGIRVCMITGDHAATARAIANSIGIIDEKNDQVVNGDILNTLSEEQLSVLDPFPCVFSRVSPDNKLKIVKALQRRGEIVAMTGDGVNDAPAIKQANVGVAMGINGTEITRQAASIVLADDNFATIVAAVQEGRSIFDNIIKFIVYLLSCNTSEVFVMLISVAVGFPPPLNAMMILWANIFADVPPSLSLGIEPPEINIMSRPPRNPKLGVITPVMTSLIIVNSLVMTAVSLVLYWYSLHIDNHDDDYAKTLCFAGLSMIQLTYSFSARSLTNSLFQSNFLSNRWMTGGVALSMLFTVLAVYVPDLNVFIGTEQLDGIEWFKIFLAMLALLVVVECEKVILRWRGVTTV